MNNNLMTVNDLVKELLEQFADTRKDDNQLYYRVLAHKGKQAGIDIHNMSMPSFLLHMKEYGFPPFETVRRARQANQAKYPHLKASKEVAEKRRELEQAYREYAREMK